MSSANELYEAVHDWQPIGEVSKQFGVTPFQLRYWHRTGAVPAQQGENGRHIYYNTIMRRRLALLLDLRRRFKMSTYRAARIIGAIQEHDLLPWRPCSAIIREAQKPRKKRRRKSR